MAQLSMLLILSLAFFTKYTDGQMEGQMGQSNMQNLGYPRPLVQRCPREWQWPCRDGECIPSYDLCDGIAQCVDGSDEWDCPRGGQRRFNNYGNVVNQYPIPDQKPNNGVQTANVQTSTTTIKPTTEAPSVSYVSLSKKDLTASLVIFGILATLVVMVIRRRARRKALSRNRRGFLPHDDSDEDDLLIRSMYS